MGWLLSWQCTSVTKAEQKTYGCCTKVGVTFTNDVFVVGRSCIGCYMVALLVLVRSICRLDIPTSPQNLGVGVAFYGGMESGTKAHRVLDVVLEVRRLAEQAGES
jgi:hypothetical protein